MERLHATLRSMNEVRRKAALQQLKSVRSSHSRTTTFSPQHQNHEPPPVLRCLSPSTDALTPHFAGTAGAPNEAFPPPARFRERIYCELPHPAPNHSHPLAAPPQVHLSPLKEHPKDLLYLLKRSWTHSTPHQVLMGINDFMYLLKKSCTHSTPLQVLIDIADVYPMYLPMQSLDALWTTMSRRSRGGTLITANGKPCSFSE